MSKAIVFFLAVLLSTTLNYSSAMEISGNTVKNGSSDYETLVVNANVTVVIISNDKARPEVVGNKTFTDLVTITQDGRTLIVGSYKKRDLKDAGVVYIPVSQLKRIQINSEAHVSSMYPLEIPNLDVVINGACKIAISNVGVLNLIETRDYTFERTVDEYRLPALVLMRKQY